MLSFKNFLLGESLTYKNDYIIEDNSILKYKNKYNSSSNKKYLRIATFKAFLGMIILIKCYNFIVCSFRIFLLLFLGLLIL